MRPVSALGGNEIGTSKQPSQRHSAALAGRACKGSAISRVGHGVAAADGLGAQTLAAARTARSKHFAATFGGQAGAEAVTAFAHQLGGLVSPFHRLNSPLGLNKGARSPATVRPRSRETCEVPARRIPPERAAPEQVALMRGMTAKVNKDGTSEGRRDTAPACRRFRARLSMGDDHGALTILMTASDDHPGVP